MLSLPEATGARLFLSQPITTLENIFFSSTRIEEALDEEIEISQIGLLEIFIPIRFSLDAQLIPASSLNTTIYSQVLLPGLSSVIGASLSVVIGWDKIASPATSGYQ